ncbi:toxin glutamine deamidase domain-containing protein [Paractinoplanes durhamensis]|uniref:toxin glutamine deamidase domain-containing protein n=1 Tax=Paractinoplanes durhamensis TaxID=113563 RepID=UPI003624F3DB
MGAAGHANPNLTSRTPDQARYEQAYFDHQAQNKQPVLDRIFARERGRHDTVIDAYRQQQSAARREMWKSRLTLDFASAAHYRSLEAHYRQKGQDARQLRDQVDDALHRVTLDLGDPNDPFTTPADFDKANKDRGHLADGPVHDNDQSKLPGGRPSSRTLRKYGEFGGLRRPLAMHQQDLERVVPRDQNGVPVRTPDPRGPLLKLLNDGGPIADPTRGYNCLDCSLSFLETYLHGRPTVSAPRTVDKYTFGESDAQPGEARGTYRAEEATGSAFTHVTPNDPTKTPAAVKVEIDRGFEAVARTLLQGGHGSTAVIVTEWQSGSAHAWNAVNHHGTLLFIDPQTGEHQDATNWQGGPGHRTLYGHTGTSFGGNAVGLHALMVDGQGNPMAVPNTQLSPYSNQKTLPAPPLAYQQQQAQLQQQAIQQQQQNQTLPAPPPITTQQQTLPPPPPITTQQPAPPITQQTTPTPPPITTQQQSAPPAPPVTTQQSAPPVTTQQSAPPVTPHTQPSPSVDTHMPQPEPTVESGDPTVRTPSVPDVTPSPQVDSSPRTEETQSSPSPSPEPAPKQRSSDPLSALDPKNDPLSVLDPAPRKTGDITTALATDTTVTPSPEPAPTVDPRAAEEQRQKENYQFATQRARLDFDESHRQGMGRDLRKQSEVRFEQAIELGRAARGADDSHDYVTADQLTADRKRTEHDAEGLLDRAIEVENGADIGDVELTGNDWEVVNETDGGSDLAVGPVETDDRSSLTGDDGPRSIDTTRRYNTRGGLRPPLRIHQTDLERAMPRDEDGNVVRNADPRRGRWFGLMNDGGPEADPTRSINCGDSVLSLFDTYMHARPRVSAPRTFDGYHNGDPSRPIGAERGVSARIENTTGGRFEGLTDVSSLDPNHARAEIRLAEGRIHRHLLSLGHGSFAFITTQDQAGRTHEIAAVNQNGTILYLDPQTRAVTENSPLRTNTGLDVPSDVVRMDALTVDGQARPRPLTTGDGPFIAADPAGAVPEPDKVYSEAQQAEMKQYGSELGLSEKQSEGFISVGSIEKPENVAKGRPAKEALTTEQVKQQMDNWTNEVRPRGYPYHFTSRAQFEAFTSEVQDLQEAYGLPSGRVVVQGSSLRTPNAGDVDVAIVVPDAQFDAYGEECRDGIDSRASAGANKKMGKDLNRCLAKGFVPKFLANRPAGVTQTFAQATHELAARYGLPGLDLSVMKASSVMIMYPDLDLDMDRQ